MSGVPDNCKILFYGYFYSLLSWCKRYCWFRVSVRLEWVLFSIVFVFVLTSVFLFCILNKKLKVPLHLTCLYSRLKSLVHSLTPKLSQSAVSGEKTRQCPGGAVVLQCCVTARCWAVMPSQSVSTISDNWLSLLRITSLLLRTRPETTAAADHSFSI